jgi:hypothetical protein
MGKKPSTVEFDGPSATSEATLTALTLQIGKFALEGTLDSRFAAKLVKRLKKEAEAIAANGTTTKPGQKELTKAFDEVNAALRDHDAGLLVTANAALRASDGVTDAGSSE